MKHVLHRFVTVTLVAVWIGGFPIPDRGNHTTPSTDDLTTSISANLSTSLHSNHVSVPALHQEPRLEEYPSPDQMPLDSPAPDSVSLDSITPVKEEGIDTTVSYWADGIDFDVIGRITTLTGHAVIRYKTMRLEAAWIQIDWNSDLMTAGGRLDTIYTDSSNTVIDTIGWVGKPVYSDGGEVMAGDHILYNYRTKKGRILQGKTQYLDGYYWGDRIKRVEENTFFVGSGVFTTCDQGEAHYHFASRDMKMMVNDKVVARPIVLYFERVPVGIVPYGIFPNRRGRHSGMLIPYYGESAGQGRFLKDVGYYFALSDYMDAQASIDYYERYGFLGRGDFRYRVRYVLDGSLQGSFVRQDFETRRERRWDLNAVHNQNIDPWTQFRMNLRLVSDNNYYTETSTTLADRLNKTIYSDATLTHSWPGTPSSVSLNLHHDQNLETNSFTQTLPRILYRHSQTRIFSPAADTPEDTRFYHKFYWSYGAEGLNRRQATNTTRDRWRGGVRQTLNFNSPQSTLRYLTVTPSISMTEDWFAEWLNYHWDNDTLVSRNNNEFRQRFTFSLGVGANTKLYGVFLNPMGVGADFRHVMTPQVSFTYRPDFSKPKWGYYGSLQIPDSTEYTWDKFYGNVLGATPVGEQQTLGLQLSNLFQYKHTAEDQVIRRDLFTLNSGTSYNFAADYFPWSNLNSSFRTSPVAGGGLGPLKSLTVDLTLQHSFYQQVGSQVIERFVWEKFTWSNPEILRLVLSTLSVGFRFSGGTQGATASAPETAAILWQSPEESVTTAPPAESPSGAQQIQPSAAPAWNLFRAPWDLTLSTHYSVNRSTDTKTFWLNGNMDIDVTEKWKIGYTTRLDLIEGDLVSAGVTIYRDLHCWEGRLVWNPIGLGKGYFLRISIKSPQLQDIKLEQRRGSGTFLGF